MSGFSGQLLRDFRSRDELGTDAFGTTTGDALSATFGQSFAENPTSVAARSISRAAQDGTSRTALEHWANYQDPAGREVSRETMAIAQDGEPEQPSTILTKEQAAEKYKIPGLTFNEPVSDVVAKALFDTHKEALTRQDVIARAGGGFGFAVAKFGVSFLAGMLDPLNIATAFIPVVPEAFVAARMAAAAGAAGRTAVRVGVGATEGAVGQALLEPGQMYFNAKELNDYTYADTLNNIMFGAAFGGALRGVGGRLFDPRMPPEDVRAIAQVAIAQVIDGRPVDIGALVDHAFAREAEWNLTRWYKSLTRRMGEPDEAPVSSSLDRGRAIARTEARLTELQVAADDLRAEHYNVSTVGEREAARAQRGRLADRPALRLEAERSQAQQTGLSVALTRTEAERSQIQARLTSMREADAAATAEETAARTAYDRRQEMEKARNASREDTVANLMEKELRSFASNAGVELAPGEARSLAREFASYGPADFKDAVTRALNDLAERSPVIPSARRGPPPPDTPATPAGGRPGPAGPSTPGNPTPLAPNATTGLPEGSAVAQLRSQANDAANEVRAKAQEPYVDPVVKAAQERNQALIDNAVTKANTPDGAVKEVEALTQEAKAAYDIEVKSGRIVEDAEMKAALDEATAIETQAKAEAEAASCVAKGMN